MKINLDDLHYRIKTDYSFKKHLRIFLIIGGTGALLIIVFMVVGIVFFSSAIISFLFTNVPGLMEIGFNYARDFAGPLILEDLTAILNPLTGGTNVNEMKNLILQYFNQLNSNPAIDFQNFQNFISSIKNSIVDNQITNTELELVRQFMLN